VAPGEPAGFGLAGGDWPAQATNAIVDLVGTVRDKTTGPITTIARGVVFGLFAGVVGLIVAILALIAVIRLLDEALPSGVWLPYLILGTLFVIGGALVFRKRNVPTP
jgi:vacuolar-type H+-ATPase subunit I/STV1